VPPAESCARCGRPVPSDDDDEHLSWEVTADDNAADGCAWICPDCITPEEQQAIDEADIELGNEVRALAGHCARCLKNVPYETDDPGEPLPSGWAVLDADIDALLVVCPDCRQAR
jgi:DNA-directed RNA polymerase subunit RPC12/RpoP